MRETGQEEVRGGDGMYVYQEERYWPARRGTGRQASRAQAAGQDIVGDGRGG